MSNALYPPGVELEDRGCPNGCPPSDRLIVEGQDRIHGVPGRFRIVLCEHCGLMRTNPRPTPQTIGAYYPDDYAPHRPATSETKKKARHWRHRVKDRIRRIFGRDTRRLPDIPPGHVVEIWCASGAYLLQLRDEGWTAEGIEYSDAAAGHARARGLNVQTGSVETAAAPGQPADIVAAWMVLEHLHDPIHALRKIRSWVKPGGYLVGVVPDASAWDRKTFGEHWYALHLPAHLYHYTPQTLRKVFANAGWELVQLRWQPNANNLLNTLEWWLQDQPRPKALKVVQWLKNSRRASTLRRWMGWILGLTHQSGRMEFWARPLPDAKAGA